MREARYEKAAAAIVATIEKVLENGPRTPDMCGDLNTVQLGTEIAQALA